MHHPIPIEAYLVMLKCKRKTVECDNLERAYRLGTPICGHRRIRSIKISNRHDNARRRYPNDAKEKFFEAIPIVLFLTLVLVFPVTVFGDAHEMNRYKMNGKIRGIDLNHQTIVIEVPLGSTLFTVGGPLASDAKLTRSGQPATLSDFS